jgi:hypothetical protein
MLAIDATTIITHPRKDPTGPRHRDQLFSMPKKMMLPASICSKSDASQMARKWRCTPPSSDLRYLDLGFSSEQFMQEHNSYKNDAFDKVTTQRHSRRPPRPKSAQYSPATVSL